MSPHGNMSMFSSLDYQKHACSWPSCSEGEHILWGDHERTTGCLESIYFRMWIQLGDLEGGSKEVEFALDCMLSESDRNSMIEYLNKSHLQGQLTRAIINLSLIKK